MAVFYVDGVAQATLSFTRGSIYRFDQSNASNAADVLLLSEVDDGEHNTDVAPSEAVPYEGGITYWINNQQVGSTTYRSNFSAAPSRFFQIEVPVDAPSVLYYFAVGTADMGGVINVSG